MARSGTVDDNRIFGRKYYQITPDAGQDSVDANYASYGGNPIFKQRSLYYGNCGVSTPGTRSASGSDCKSSTGGEFLFINAGQIAVVGTACAAGKPMCDYATATTSGATGTAACILGHSLVNTDCTVATQMLFMGDGREDVASSTVTEPSTTTGQEQPYTRCLVCHDSQEFLTPPSAANQVTLGCWNPSGSSVFDTDQEATMDPRKYCQPANGFCSTTTWQYSTRDKAGTTTSHWVGVERGCSDVTTEQTAPSYESVGNDYNFKRALSSTKAYVRYHAATNTASKAKDNAKV